MPQLRQCCFSLRKTHVKRFPNRMEENDLTADFTGVLAESTLVVRGKTTVSLRSFTGKMGLGSPSQRLCDKEMESW